MSFADHPMSTGGIYFEIILFGAVNVKLRKELHLSLQFNKFWSSRWHVRCLKCLWAPAWEREEEMKEILLLFFMDGVSGMFPGGRTGLVQVLLQGWWDSVSSLFWCFSKAPPVWSRPVNITEGEERDNICGSLHVLVPTGHNGPLRVKKAKKWTTNPRNCQAVFLSPQEWVGDPAWCHHTDARCFCHFRTQKHLFWWRTTLLLQIPLSSPLHWILQVLFTLATESFLLGILKWQYQTDES